MLVLSRKVGESLVIGAAGVTLTEPIVVTVERCNLNRARIGVQAQADVPIHRQELYEAIQREHERSAK